jgi:hypothetical protein
MAKKSQIQKFRDKARELGADDDEARFASSLRAVAAAHKPSSDNGAPKAAKVKRSEKKRGR